MAPERPSVSVVVPFAGDARRATELLAALVRLELAPGDELIVADDTREETVPERDGVRVVRTGGSGSAYSARNAALTLAGGDWVLFTDADCIPDPGLLGAFFSPVPGPGTGILSGAVLPRLEADSAIARYQHSRSPDEQESHARHHHLPFGATANLLVRRAALDAVGGFHDGIRSGGDVDLCWRIQEAGWGFERRPAARVHHAQRESLRALMSQHLRYGAGARWLRIRHPGAGYSAPLGPRIARPLGGAARDLLRLRPAEAQRRLLDAAVVGLERAGGLRGNRDASPPPTGSGRRVALLADSFPEISETFVTAEAQALVTLGARVRVEAIGRARRPSHAEARGLDARYMEDDGTLARLRDLAWLARRAPVACLRDVRDRRHWAREERVLPLRSLAPLARRCHDAGDEHLHAHFGSGAALVALRVSRVLGIPYSVTLHGYDIFKTPRNLAAKLGGAAFATSGSHFTVAHIAAAHPEAAPRLRRIVMGVDPARWRRASPHPAGGLVVAVGRLVEKKGFDVLLRAAARLHAGGPVERIVIVGDGPLREDLERLHARLGLGELVEFAGARPPGDVRRTLEDAALVTIPCVIAADGDADSMPVIAKEALAMEIPLVTSDAAGLPEVAMEPWARVVPAGEEEALARALEEVASLPPERRAEMGGAGRAFVEARYTVAGETRRLLDLMDAAVAGRPLPQEPAA